MGWCQEQPNHDAKALLNNRKDKKWKPPSKMTFVHRVLYVECDPGTYGPGCERKCACPPGVSCDHVTGACQRKCPPGYHGENCDQGRCPNRGHTPCPRLSSVCVLLRYSVLSNLIRLSRGEVRTRLRAFVRLHRRSM